MEKIRPHCCPQSRGNAWRSDDDLISRSFNGNKKRRRVAQRCADFLVDTSVSRTINLHIFLCGPSPRHSPDDRST